MPLPSDVKPEDVTDLPGDEMRLKMWEEAELQLNYPKTTINGEVNIDDKLEVIKNIKAGSISTTEDISCKSINA